MGMTFRLQEVLTEEVTRPKLCLKDGRLSPIRLLHPATKLSKSRPAIPSMPSRRQRKKNKNVNSSCKSNKRVFATRRNRKKSNDNKPKVKSVGNARKKKPLNKPGVP